MQDQNSDIKTRQKLKLKHVEACLLPESQYLKTAGFEKISLPNEASSSINFKDISLKTTFLSRELHTPLMIAPMTGGTELSTKLNRIWANVAEHFLMAMGVGSLRLALEESSVRSSFLVRQYAPNILLFANLGAAQLGRSISCENAQKAVEMIKADALFIHVNPMQEVIQERGDRDFSHLLPNIASVVKHLEKSNIPVLVREVGFGLSKKSVQRFLETGIAGMDAAGAGGTSWAKVEGLVATDEKYRKLGELFGEWGITTVDSIRNVRSVHADIPLIASGGIRSGLDVAKALSLGANIAAMAQPMLVHGMKGEEALIAFIDGIHEELKIAMFGAGVKKVEELLGLDSLTF